MNCSYISEKSEFIMKKTPKILIAIYVSLLLSAGLMSVVVENTVPVIDVTIMQQKLIKYPELRPFFDIMYEDGKITKSEYNKFYNELFYIAKE